MYMHRFRTVSKRISKHILFLKYEQLKLVNSTMCYLELFLLLLQEFNPLSAKVKVTLSQRAPRLLALLSLYNFPVSRGFAFGHSAQSC